MPEGRGWQADTKPLSRALMLRMHYLSAMLRTVILVLLVWPLVVGAQQIGQWRTHFSFNGSLQVAAGGGTVYTTNGPSLLLFDRGTGELITLDESTGLSATGVDAFAYSPAHDALVVAYTNSDIDVVSQDLSVVNIPDVRTETGAGSKRINHVHATPDGVVYAAADFGVLKIDVPNAEIDETYVIGDDGSPVVVTEVVRADRLLAAATDEGLKTAVTDSANLLDFSNWSHDQDGLPEQAGIDLASWRDTLYAAVNDTLFRLDTGWTRLAHDSAWTILDLRATEGLHAVQQRADTSGAAVTTRLVRWSAGGWEVLDSSRFFARDLVLVDGTTGYIADVANGLYRLTPGGATAVGTPNAPFSNTAVSIDHHDGAVYVAGGSVTEFFEPRVSFDGYSVYDGTQWTAFNPFNTPGLQSVRDVLTVKHHPETGDLYAATSTGLVVFDGSSYTLYDASNSPLRDKFGNAGYAVVSDVAFAPDGSVWVLNYGPESGPALHRLRPDGSWESENTPSTSGLLREALVDPAGQLWLVDGGDGLIVRTAEGDYISLGTSASEGNLPNAAVRSLALTQDGALWVGTEAGVAVFDCPLQVATTPECRVSRQITATLGEYAEYLFETDVVQAIAVDGADRKWVGTENGAWLVSPTGEAEVLRFTASETPLPSDNIIDIGILQTTGEVFFATDLGLVSYFGDATEGAETHDDVRIFPNPVRPEYQGPISITGLVTNAWVTITDVAGNMIDEGPARGGKFTWNGADHTGRRGRTGVYFVFSSNADGTEKHVGKIVLVNGGR